jgi:hypothetical protein
VGALQRNVAALAAGAASGVGSLGGGGHGGEVGLGAGPTLRRRWLILLPVTASFVCPPHRSSQACALQCLSTLPPGA